jgi:hypothetical protein
LRKVRKKRCLERHLLEDVVLVGGTPVSSAWKYASLRWVIVVWRAEAHRPNR